jgi:hypothetical protein
MKKPVLIVGTALITFGIGLFLIQSVNLWNCAHSPIPTSCPDPRFVWGTYEIPIWPIFDLFLVGVGIVMTVFSLRHPQSINIEESERLDSQ